MSALVLPNGIQLVANGLPNQFSAEYRREYCAVAAGRLRQAVRPRRAA